MPTLQEAIEQSVDKIDPSIGVASSIQEPQSIDQEDPLISAIKQTVSMNADSAAAPGSKSTDQDLMESVRKQYEFQSSVPPMSYGGLNLREVSRGFFAGGDSAAWQIATPWTRSQMLQGVLGWGSWFNDLITPQYALTGAAKEARAQGFKAISDYAAMAVEPTSSGLGLTPNDMSSSIIGMRGSAQGIAQGQAEGFMADVSRATGQSLPSTAATIGSLGTATPMTVPMWVSMALIPFQGANSGTLGYFDDLEQQQAEDARDGKPLTELNLSKLQERAVAAGAIEFGTEAGFNTLGMKAIEGVVAGSGIARPGRAFVARLAKVGGLKSANVVAERVAKSAAGQAFARATENTLKIIPGFIYKAGQIVLISGAEESGEELTAGLLNSPFTKAPLSKDVTDAIYSMGVAGVSGGAGGAVAAGGHSAHTAITNSYAAFRPENDKERILRQNHTDAAKARGGWTENLDQAQRDRIAVSLDTIDGMTPSERAIYLTELANRKADIIKNAESTLLERQEVDVAQVGAQEELANAKAKNEDTYEAEFAVLSLEERAKELDKKIVLANTDHMIASAEHQAVAEKISDIPGVVVQSNPEQVLTDMGTRTGLSLTVAKIPKWGKKIANEMEALGAKVVWFTPGAGENFTSGFHTRRTAGVVYLNANSDQQRVRAVALEEAFHDIQMFRPEIAKAFSDKAGLTPIYEAAMDYIARGDAESASIARMDEAAFAQADNVATTLEGGTSDISPNTARVGAARISQEGEANAFAAAMAGIKAKGATSSLTRLSARLGLMGRESLAAIAVVDRVARAAAIEKTSKPNADPTLSPLARTLMWASDMDVDFARDIPTADRELSEPIPAPVRPAAPAQAGQVQTGPTAETTSTVGRRLVADAINTLGLTEEEVNATVIDLMTGLPKTKAFVANKIGKVPDVVKYFHGRRLASGLRILDITKEEDQKTLAKLMAAEAIGAINSAGEALQWYDKTIRNTLAQAAIKYPELETDPRARMAFILSMAITSQTMNVEDNLAFSMVQYGKYRDTVDPVTGIGQFELAGKGKNAGAQANNFRIANVMLRTIGPDQMIRFLRTQFTAGQLSNAGLNIGGELKSEMVLGSAIFGPKIGFGFYSNLDGNFDPVTMDMWFMRTIGRLTGKLPAFDQNKYDKQIAKLKASLAEKGTNGIFPSTIDQALIDDANNATDDSGLVKLARAVIKLHEKDFKDNRKDYDNKDRVQSKMVLASKSIIQSLDKPRDSPKSGGERRLLRKVVKLAVAHVSEIYGEDVANAAFQAMIWYPEQELYKSHGVKLKVTSQDYSGAIRKILKNEGITDGQLDTAIAAAERGSGLAQQVAGVPDTGTGGLTSNVPVQTRTFSDAERASFLATTPVSIAKAWNPPAQDPNLNELQARFAGDFQAIRFTREQRRSAYSSNWQYGRSIVGNGTKPRILKLTDESGKKSSLPYIAEIAPGDALGIVFKKAGLLSPKFVELAPVKVSAIWFNKTVSAFKVEDKFGACVAAYPADDYVGMRLFIATNGRSGFAVKPDGDVISVFAYDKHGRAILEASTAVGGKKLDAFDTVLPVIYAAHGFKATSRLKFSEQEKPEGWNYETFKRFNNGRPDVVFMVNDPTSMTQYQPTDGQLVEDYGEAVAIQDGVVSDVSFAREKTSKPDIDYMAAVDRGDMETAQRMVDEKAKAAGYNVDVFRGDASAFKTFLKSEQGKNFEDLDLQIPRGFFWFTTSKTRANWYAKFASRNSGTQIVRRFYLNPGNIFVYPTEKIADEGMYGVPSVESELAQLGDYNSMLIPVTAKWVTERDESGELQYKLDKGKYKYYAVTNPTQIKSADPITYDESGNVVPLSRRFDDTNEDISFSREDERDVAFQKMQADRRAAQAEVMKDLSPREQALIIEAGVADYDEILDLKDKIDKLKKQIAGGTPAAVEKSKRTADLQTAAQRVNALSEVRKLERKLNAMTMLADQRLGQVNRAKARLQTQTQLAIEEQQSATETIASLEEQITATRDAVVAAKRSIAEERTATKEQRDALNTALANAEATAQRAINWAYAIGRNEGLVAGQVAGQQSVQTDLERGQQAEEKLKELQKSERFQKFANQRAIDWAYRIGRNEGLDAGQVAGQQTLKPEMTRLARVESLLDISVRRVRELKATVRNDARAAQRAVNFAYSMGLNKGRMQGIMQGRAQILARMRRREDTLQNQLFNLRELMNTRLDDVAGRNRIIRKIVSDALLALPAKLRGTLANRAATATTVAQANRVAIEAIRIAINAEVTDGIAAIKKTQKRMNKRGMKWAARQQIEKLLDEANTVLRDANNRKRTAKVVTAKGSPVTLVDAVALYADVIDAAAKVESAVALYTVDRNEYIAERDQRIARYADLTKRILQNMGGRKVRLERLRADQAPRLSLMSRISRANSDIYTLAIELEGTTTGVIDEMLRLAQEGKGEAALEHARLMRDLLPALQAAGYESLDDYRLRNGGYGDGSTELVTVSLGGKDATIPLGIAMSIAAMDEETLDLFNEGKQSLKFSATSTILEFTPTQADIELIRSNLTPEQRALIEASKDILETQIRDRAMEAIWQVQGDQPPIVLRYYPRIRDMTGTGGEEVSISAAIGAAVRGALTSVGFANARVGGNQPLIYSDMLQTMDRHIQVALDMIHMAQPYRDAMTVLNNPEVIKGIDSQLGVDTTKGVRSIFSNGVGATQRSVPTLIDTVTGNVTSAVLTMNPTTVAKVVMGGTIRLSSEIPLSVWTRGTARAAAYARKPGRWSSRVDEIHLLNGYFTRRHQMQMKSIFSGALNDSDRAQLGNALKAMRDNFRATGQNLVAKQITDAIHSVGDVNRAGTLALSAIIDALRYADEQIMMAAVESRLAEIEDEGILTGRDALREAANRAERDFRLTQNASDEFDDTYYAATSRTSGNSSWRILFPFSSDPLKARNQIRRAWLSGDKATMGRTAVAVGGNIGSSVAVSSLSKIAMAKTLSLIGSLLFGSDDDDSEDKEWLKQMKTSVPVQLVQELSQNILGYWGMVFANVLSAAVYSRSAGAPLIGTPAVQTYQEASKYWKKDSTAIDKTQAVIGSTLALVQYSGIPFYAIYRLVSAAIALNKSKPTEREKLLKSIERRREHLKKLRSN